MSKKFFICEFLPGSPNLSRGACGKRYVQATILKNSNFYWGPCVGCKIGRKNKPRGKYKREKVGHKKYVNSLQRDKAMRIAKVLKMIKAGASREMILFETGYKEVTLVKYFKTIKDQNPNLNMDTVRR